MRRTQRTISLLGTSALLGLVLGVSACEAPPTQGTNEREPKAAPGAAEDPAEAAPAKAGADAAMDTGRQVAPTEAAMLADGETGEPADAEDMGAEDAAATTGAEDEAGEAATDATGGATASDTAPKSDDIRHASHVPGGTPEAHASAFAELPKRKGDGAPIGGIGPGGIHLDDLVVGTDWEDSRCQTPKATFSVSTDDKVSLCLRIVHQPEEEALKVEWVREGRSPREANVTVTGIHAYRTRVWLPAKNYNKGKWKVRVLASDETLLGEGSFEITD